MASAAVAPGISDPEDEISYEGVLEKKGHTLLASWKVRHFVLQQDTDNGGTWEIRYFESKGGALKGTIPLSRATIQLTANPREFLVTTSSSSSRASKVFPLRGQRGTDVDAWMSRIKAAIDDSIELDHEKDQRTSDDEGGSSSDDDTIDGEEYEVTKRQELSSSFYRPHQFQYGDRVYIDCHDDASNKTKAGSLHCIPSATFAQCGLVLERDLNAEQLSYCEFEIVSRSGTGTSSARTKQQDVTYGEPLLLRHVMSGYFLCDRIMGSSGLSTGAETMLHDKYVETEGRQVAADIQKENYRVVLLPADYLNDDKLKHFYLSWYVMMTLKRNVIHTPE
jgi:hypothetical protein